ncbi:MAG: hypothetical protein PUD59_06310 [bacterium]|nr:hypothetical protein [bacterium]
MNKYSLEIPLYLNQKIVFDLLASINDGFTQVTKLKTASATEGSFGGTVEADLGNKNIFALLGVKLKGKVDAEHNKEHSKEQEQEKIHTPSSLFNNLKAQLFKEKMVKRINGKIDDIYPGEFVEISGILKINPLITMMENMTRVLELATVMQNDGTGKRAKQKNLEDKKTIMQMEAFTNSLKANGMVDMICEMEGAGSCKAVLPVYMDYFFNGNSSEIVDGKFKVLGKVAKVCNQNEKIDLLRNTSLSIFKESLLEEMLSGFNADSNQEMNIGELETIVQGPALLIIPIAIYL